MRPVWPVHVHTLAGAAGAWFTRTPYTDGLPENRKTPQNVAGRSKKPHDAADRRKMPPDAADPLKNVNGICHKLTMKYAK